MPETKVAPKAKKPRRKAIDQTKIPRIPSSGSIVIEVDDREKLPLPFPSRVKVNDKWRVVEVETVRLVTGDCRLKALPNLVGFEFKRSGDELVGNLDGPDAVRANKAFMRMAQDYIYPYLLLEFSPSSLWTAIERKHRYVSQHNGNHQVTLKEYTDWIMWKLSMTVASYGLHLMWGGQKSSDLNVRGHLGDLVLHLMLAHAKMTENQNV